jgi:RNA polymerase sigma-70 factor (ECF subfamily)
LAIDVENLYTRYGPMVLRRCRAMLRHEEEAADAMQDVFVRLLAERARLDPLACSSLVYRVATNVCLNRLRTRRRRPEDAQSELLANVAVACAAERVTAARALLGRLLGTEPESSGVIAVLHLHDGLTLEEVAAEVGMSVSGVRKRLRRLQERLQTLEEAAPKSPNGVIKETGDGAQASPGPRA